MCLAQYTLSALATKVALGVQQLLATSATRCACKVCHHSAEVCMHLLAICSASTGSPQTVGAAQVHLLQVQSCTCRCPL